jgi:hypothetical protein
MLQYLWFRKKRTFTPAVRAYEVDMSQMDRPEVFNAIVCPSGPPRPPVVIAPRPFPGGWLRLTDPFGRRWRRREQIRCWDEFLEREF